MPKPAGKWVTVHGHPVFISGDQKTVAVPTGDDRKGPRRKANDPDAVYVVTHSIPPRVLGPFDTYAEAATARRGALTSREGYDVVKASSRKEATSRA